MSQDRLLPFTTSEYSDEHDGQAEPRQPFTRRIARRRQMVTHPRTNRARSTVSVLIETYALTLSRTANSNRCIQTF